MWSLLDFHPLAQQLRLCREVDHAKDCLLALYGFKGLDVWTMPSWLVFWHHCSKPTLSEQTQNIMLGSMLGIRPEHLQYVLSVQLLNHGRSVSN